MYPALVMLTIVLAIALVAAVVLYLFNLYVRLATPIQNIANILIILLFILLAVAVIGGSKHKLVTSLVPKLDGVTADMAALGGALDPTPSRTRSV